MEVITQIGHRFKVETSEIKKVRGSCFQRPSLRVLTPRSQAIGSLIDREYLRRSEAEQNVFEYLA